LAATFFTAAFLAGAAFLAAGLAALAAGFFFAVVAMDNSFTRE
jgi:hypothetical protein